MNINTLELSEIQKIKVSDENPQRELIIKYFIVNIVNFAPFLFSLVIAFLKNYFNYEAYLILQIISLILFIFQFYILIIKYYKIKISYTTIKSMKVQKPFNITFVADLHLSKGFNTTNYIKLRRIVNKINSTESDILIIGGDIIDDKFYPEILDELKRIKKKYKFAVYGNHDTFHIMKDRRSEIPSKLINKLNEAGISVLLNENVKIPEYNLLIGGITDLYSMHFDISNTLKTNSNLFYKILVSHNPDAVDFIKKDKPDLLLSGHTHKGQIYIKGLDKYLPIPCKHIELLHGLYDFDNYKVFVTEGAGTCGTRVRLGSENEICLIKFTK